MDNRRLILLLVFSFSLVTLWEAWQKYNHPKDVAPVAAASTAPAPAQGVPVPTPTAVPTGTPALPASASAPAVQGEVVRVKTDLFSAEVSTVGGDIVGQELVGYKSSEDKEKLFRLFDAKHQYAAQSGLIGEHLPTHKTVYRVLPGKRELAEGEDKLTLKLEAPVSGNIKVSKIMTFKRGSYLVDVAYEISNGSAAQIAPYAYYQLQRDTQAPAGEARFVSTYTGPAMYTAQGHYQKIDFKDIEKGSAKFEQKADNGWMAMVQHYFVSAWIPQEKLEREFYVRKQEGGANLAVAAGVIVPVTAVAPGATVVQATSLYAGPQIQSVLDTLAKPLADGGIGAVELSRVVDYGNLLTPIAAPIFWMLSVIHKFVGNWGWAIVLLTVLIKLAFFPLSAASYKSMAKMRALAPRMQALKERCGDDRQKLNMEMMALYKVEKINPLGGCLPIVVQIPVFIALYWALLGAVEMRDAPWILWITDLSSQDPYYILPVIMVVSMLIQTKLNPTPPDPVQAKVTMAMPFVFGFMFFWFPAGLVLYWVVNNVLSIAQQWQITRMIERGGQAANDAKA